MEFVYKSCSSEDLLVQQRTGWSSAKGRLKREDCEFVKHDKLFSNWKILVGPSDWSEHMAGKDGIDRYHLHNLPAAHFGPGVYELGVTTSSWSPTSHRLRPRTLKREDVMAVYVGQADNIRLRLQKYGRGGSHLEGSSLGSTNSGNKTLCNGPHLFSEVFAHGNAIAFRWAQTDNKVVAKQVESELLVVFDYAWNKGNNGNRRSLDILAKLFMVWPRNEAFYNPKFSGKYIFYGTNAVGIKVALRKPLDAPSNSNKNMGYFMTTPPQVPIRLASLEMRCSVLTNEGTPCSTPPVKGRKRCLQHKGMRVASLEMRCGVLIDEGTPCSTPPIKGRKRCLQHKGMRVASLELQCGVLTDEGTPCSTPPIKGCKQCLQHEGMRVASLELQCGVLTDEGTPCNTSPVKGRKRCLQHKGMRVRGATAAVNAPLLPTSEEYNMKRESVQVGGGSVCLPRVFLGRSRPKSRPVCSTDFKPVCKTECKEEPGVGQRQLSLSFNTRMKMEEFVCIR